MDAVLYICTMCCLHDAARGTCRTETLGFPDFGIARKALLINIAEQKYVENYVGVYRSRAATDRYVLNETSIKPAKAAELLITSTT